MKIKYLMLCLLTSVLLTFSYPNFIEKDVNISTSFFIWFAYVPLFYVLFKTGNIKHIFFYSLFSFSVFYLLSLYWLIYVKPMGIFAIFAWIGLSILYCAMIMSLCITLIKIIFDKYNMDLTIGLPISLTLAEYLREWVLTGFPLLNPAQSQYNFRFFIQILKYTGTYGAIFFIILINIIITKIFLKEKIKNIFFYFIFFILFAFILMGNFSNKAKLEPVIIGILQSNNDQSAVWNLEYKNNVMQKYKKLIFNIKDKKPDLIIWPETGYPGILNLEKDAAKKISHLYFGSNTYHLVGSDKAVKNSSGKYDYYNAAFLITPDGRVADDYEKYHLVPFGEYIPFHTYFPFIDKVVRRYGYVSFKHGKELKIFSFKNFKTGALICYDSMFPEISRTYVKKGAQFLSHLSYENWYGNSCASAQIFTNIALRAIENNVWVARCVEAGISGIINNRGEIIYTTKLFEEISFASTIYVEKDKKLTFYTQYGNWFIWFLFVIIILNIIFRKKNDNIDK